EYIRPSQASKSLGFPELSVVIVRITPKCFLSKLSARLYIHLVFVLTYISLNAKCSIKVLEGVTAVIPKLMSCGKWCRRIDI
ncbi:hypothetical protein BaRGS_00032629, partial [Batillaria attramentaria]